MNTGTTDVLAAPEVLPPKQKAVDSNSTGRTTQTLKTKASTVKPEILTLCLCQANCPTRRAKHGQKPVREDLTYKTKYPCDCLEAVIDAADWDLVKDGFWRSVKGKRTNNIYVQDTRHWRWLHRVITGADRGQVVDHVDGNPLNNTRANLRVCTHKENIRNSRLCRTSTTGFKGVHRQTNPYNPKKPYMARIVVDGKKLYLGQFSDPEDAARAYDAAADQHFGEFARLNFPDLPHREAPEVQG